VLSCKSSGDAGFGSRASPVTSLAEGGTTCRSSFDPHGTAGSGRVYSSSMNEADGRGAEAASERARSA
jgi:hypothetical protein